MKYVYQVTGNFAILDFAKTITKIQQNCFLMYVDGAMYVAPFHYNQLDNIVDSLQKIFKPIAAFNINDVNESNINDLSYEAKNWCLYNIVRLEKERYELEQQLSLQCTLQRLDFVEEHLSKLEKGEYI